jgi:hypothetical protein
MQHIVVNSATAIHHVGLAMASAPQTKLPRAAGTAVIVNKKQQHPVIPAKAGTQPAIREPAGLAERCSGRQC